MQFTRIAHTLLTWTKLPTPNKPPKSSLFGRVFAQENAQ
jgi:hypothetical protein